MKKISICLIILTLIASIFIAVPTISYAEDYGIADSFDPGEGKIEKDTLVERIKPIYSVLYTISIIVTVITLMIVGLKFIGASVYEKADYKNSLIPIAVRSNIYISITYNNWDTY